ncbi:DsrE family protein [Spongiivirga sp. MCCC 1A20706]|uniref:DsrE family protein n=1 Tax=Spongiivirga sp. MCCC 1A20706 TaxID=3160963 RepID=UPI0039777CEF
MIIRNLFLLLLLTSLSTLAQKKGPIIKAYGAVKKIENPDYKTDTAATFKVVFDVMDTPNDLNAINKKIETAARFLNMHAQAGVPKEQLKVALVVHNKASKDIITDKAYKKRYQTKNPNSKLLESLLNEGVQVIFCGQSSKSRGFPKEDLIPGTQISLSAMTALIQLQNQNYRLIKF